MFPKRKGRWGASGTYRADQKANRMSIPLTVMESKAPPAGAVDLELRRTKIAADLAREDVGEIRFGLHDRLLYSTDASLYQIEPIGVIIPHEIEHVRRALIYCAANTVAVFPRGGGTSLAGQCTNDAVVLDFSPSFRKLGEVDIGARTCCAEVGISIDEINRILALRKTGLFFAPDPATTAQATIGGCIGNNAAGARSIRYGRTSENIAGVDVLLSSGNRIWLEAGAGRRDPVARTLATGVADIVRRYATQIRQRFPKLVRRNAGYGLDLVLRQLDAGITAEDLDLSGLICGSEGTLAVVVGARLKLHPVPTTRILMIASYESVDDAIEVVPQITKLGVSAVELLDDVVMEAARGNAECRHYLSLIPKIGGSDATAALYVEFQQEAANETNRAGVEERVSAIRTFLGKTPVNIYRDSEPMRHAWTLRKSGEALLHNLLSDRKPVTFVEDNSIPVENLARFVKEFRRIVTSHGTSAAYYAHASVGVLHVRPQLDLHQRDDLEIMRSIAVEVADLARECGGVMSGEHGDGRVRGPLLERFYGLELTSAFAEIKRQFDPAGILNPGMIVGAGSHESITQNLRIQAEGDSSRPASIETYFDYGDAGNFGEAVERCNGAGFCRKIAGGTMCPSYRATLDERHSTRGRGNALRLAITGQTPRGNSAVPAWNDAETMRTLDLCLSCKACKTECPSNVDLARLKAEYMAQSYKSTGKIPLQARLFGQIRLINQLASVAPGIAQFVSRRGIVRSLAERFLGVSTRRTLPPVGRSLYRTFGKRRKMPAGEDKPRVVLFADCFTTYNEPEIGLAAIEVLESLGYVAVLPRVGCCGRAMISNGLLRDAIGTADLALDVLREYILDDSVKGIVLCEPSCLSAMTDDWLQLKLRTEMSLRQGLAKKAMLIETFVDRFWGEHPNQHSISGGFKPEGREILLHSHCHQKALWGVESSAGLIRRAARDRLRVLDSGCCGMAGSFGFSVEHYDLSMKIGELSVFGAIRETPRAVVLAPGTSCRHQIRDGTGREARHPIQWFAEAIQAAQRA
jgi:FAD/FMN-containing dehydrogenase/Fe-S oxidoreductase